MKAFGTMTLMFTCLLACNSKFLDSKLSSSSEGDKGEATSETVADATGLPTQKTESTQTASEEVASEANEPVMTAGGFLRCSLTNPDTQNQIGCAIVDEENSNKINVPGLRDNLIEAVDENLTKLDITFTYTNEGDFHWVSSTIAMEISLIRIRPTSDLQGLGNQNELVEVQEETPAADAEQFSVISNRRVTTQNNAWVRGNPGINCLTTCQADGGVDRTAMESFSNESFCRDVIVAMGLTIQSVNTTDFAVQNLGCLFRPDLGVLYISGVNNIDLNLGQGGIERICTCTNSMQ